MYVCEGETKILAATLNQLFFLGGGQAKGEFCLFYLFITQNHFPKPGICDKLKLIKRVVFDIVWEVIDQKILELHKT